MLKVYNYDILFQEVPNEVSLVLNISNCPYHCPSCHSKFLWEDVGESLDDILKDLLDKYKNLITFVCFMGGDQSADELISALNHIKQIGLKTCLYTGCDNLNELTMFFPYLDFLKYGSYRDEFGGLDSENTNQVFLSKKNSEWLDTTFLFQRKNKNTEKEGLSDVRK